MWHAKNLQDGRPGSYLTAYGLTPATDPADTLTGTYARNYSAALAAPWLWNAQKRVFLSTEDDQSIGAKADYVVAKGIGGIMIWELAGDYAFNTGAQRVLLRQHPDQPDLRPVPHRRAVRRHEVQHRPCRPRPSTSACRSAASPWATTTTRSTPSCG